MVAALIDLGLVSAAAAVIAQLAAGLLKPRFSYGEMSYLALAALFLVALASVVPTALIAYQWQRGRSTLGHRLLGLAVLRRTTGGPLPPLAAFSRWVLLYAPVALWTYPLVVSTVYDPAPFMMLIELPHAPFVGIVLPLAWYAVLGLTTLRDRRRGRGLHDVICGSIVVRRSA